MKKLLSLFFLISIVSCSKDDSTSNTTISSINLIWTKAIGGSKDDSSNAIAKTIDGGAVVVGYTTSDDDDVSSNYGAFDFLVVKLDASGNKQWTKNFGGSGFDFALAVVSTADGGYAVAGRTDSNDGDVSDSHGKDDLWLVKLDASGNKQWAKTFGGSGDDEARSIIITSDGGYVIAGNTASTDGDVTGNHGSTDIWVLKLDSSGTIQWAKTFGGSDDDKSTSIITSTDGGYAITGYTASTDGDIANNHGLEDVWVLKLDASGSKQWSKTYGGSGYDDGSSIITTADGGYAIAGSTASMDGDVTGSHGGDDAWLVKLDASANQQWAKTFGGSADDNAVSVIVTPDGQYVISGYSNSADGDVTTNHGGVDGFILAFDKLGNKLLAKTFGGTSDDVINALTITTDEKYIVTGHSTSTDGDVSENHGANDFWVMQLGLK